MAAAETRMTTPAAEPVAVETPAKPRSKRAPAASAKRRPATRTTKPKPAPDPVPVEGSRSALVVLRIVAAAVAAAAGIFLLVGGEREAKTTENRAAGVVSPEELSTFARSSATDVYWAGNVGSRRLQLTANPTATFVRYLSGGSAAGSSLTVATYPVADAYSTAVRRSRSDGMTSRRIAGNGIAVWSVEQPTSVYLAWRRTPSLVEVYAPTAAEARSVALSGRVRPVR